MSDGELRELERRYRTSGLEADGAAWLAEAMRSGAVPRERVALAAALGHRLARDVLGARYREIDRPRDREIWLRIAYHALDATHTELLGAFGVGRTGDGGEAAFAAGAIEALRSSIVDPEGDDGPRLARSVAAEIRDEVIGSDTRYMPADEARRDAMPYYRLRSAASEACELVLATPEDEESPRKRASRIVELAREVLRAHARERRRPQNGDPDAPVARGLARLVGPWLLGLDDPIRGPESRPTSGVAAESLAAAEARAAGTEPSLEALVALEAECERVGYAYERRTVAEWRALLLDSNPDVARNASVRLARMGRRAVPACVEALESPNAATVRIGVGLARKLLPVSDWFLARLVAVDTSEAWDLLAAQGPATARVLPALLARVDAPGRRFAREGPARVFVAMGPPAVEPLRQRLASPDRLLAFDCALALRSLGAPVDELAPVLHEAFSLPTADRVDREWARAALVLSGQGATLVPHLERWSRGEAGERRDTIRVIEHLGVDAVPCGRAILERLIHDEDRWISSDAGQVLARVLRTREAWHLPC